MLGKVLWREVEDGSGKVLLSLHCVRQEKVPLLLEASEETRKQAEYEREQLELRLAAELAEFEAEPSVSDEQATRGTIKLLSALEELL